MAHVPRGGEIIADVESHIVYDEAASSAVVTGASLRTLVARADGTLDPAEIRDAFRDPSDAHQPITSLVAIENTHAHSGGQPLTAAYTAEVAAVAHAGGVPLHVDGARLFNAAVALGTTARDLLKDVDSASFCLSKGLACPIGSVVVGDRDFIWRAWRARKLLGGGMRQVGVLAAAGLVALRDGPSGMIERLAEDHANARRIADTLADMAGINGLDPATVRTNFVVFGVGAPAGSTAARLAPGELRTRFLAALATDGVLMVEYPHDRIRAVTHYGIEASEVDATVAAVRRALATVGVAPQPVIA
jgi:threonine aldolase